jgi:hypothetical protein
VTVVARAAGLPMIVGDSRWRGRKIRLTINSHLVLVSQDQLLPIATRLKIFGFLHNSERRGLAMQIKLTSIFVDDQEKALKFYTEVLGFQKKHDFAGGGNYRWLTVVSPEEPEGVQLVLEASEGINPAAKPYQQEIHRSGIPAANFFCWRRSEGTCEADGTRREVYQGAYQDARIDHRSA